MTLLGLDFDNTIVKYDKLFHRLALEKGLIDTCIPKQKTAVREHLIKRGQENMFTFLQGEVYGNRISEAEPAIGMLEALRQAKENGAELLLISHKTKYPFKGPKYDLHKAAMEWLEMHGFFNTQKGLCLKKENIYFEESRRKKIRRIVTTGCSIYVDDLPEILKMIPDKVKRILYDPEEYHKTTNINIDKMDDWNKLTKIIR